MAKCQHEDISVNDFQIPYKVYCYECKQYLVEEEFKKLKYVQKVMKENRERNLVMKAEFEKNKDLCVCGHRRTDHKAIGDPDVTGGCKRCGCTELGDIREHISKMDRKW